MVRLRAAEGIVTSSNSLIFQFLYGAIEGCATLLTSARVSYFNSFMVRLRVMPKCRSASTSILFQFLYGAIEGPHLGDAFETLYIFQFLYGAIEGITSIPLVPSYLNFNSFMVRLRV